MAVDRITRYGCGAPVCPVPVPSLLSRPTQYREVLLTIPFNVPFVAGTELQYLREAIEGGHFGGNGPFAKRVQSWLEHQYGFGEVLLTHSCTGALEMAALLLDLAPGDEVVLPSYTFPTTASAFLRAGARLVFAEIDPATMTLDWRDVERRLTDRTRAIVPVHYGGIAADMPELLALADSRGITVVEDAAQGLGARYGDRWLGTLSPLGTLSFHETKNVHCGLGGALLLNAPEYRERAGLIWDRGTDRRRFFEGRVDRYSWVELGSSFAPSELQAAFLLAQLEAFDENQSRRRRLYEAYDQRLRPLAAREVIGLPEIGPHRTLNFHSYFLVAPSAAACTTLRRHLVAEGIQAVIGYTPLHSSLMGQRLGYRAEDLLRTEEFAQRVLRLPFHHQLTEVDVDRIADSITLATR